jgi:hypothetical protein
MTTTRSDPLGFDLYVGPVPGGGVDMFANGRACSGIELVRNAMVARSMADTISMLGAPGDRIEFGRDVRAWVGSVVTDATAASRSQELATIYARDPRIDPGSILVSITTTRAGAAYDFVIQVNARTTTAQPIAMVLGVNAISVDVLAQQGTT